MTTATTLVPLTDAQRAVFDFILSHWRAKRMAPTNREIQLAMGFGSPNGSVCHVQALQRKGWIEQHKNVARSLIPTEEALAHVAANT
jgi:repressor LexA